MGYGELFRVFEEIGYLKEKSIHMDERIKDLEMKLNQLNENKEKVKIQTKQKPKKRSDISTFLASKNLDWRLIECGKGGAR